MRQRFVGKPQHGNGGPLMQIRFQLLHEARGNRSVEMIVDFQQLSRCTKVFSDEVECDIVTRKTQTAKAESAREVFASNALVHPNSIAHYIDIPTGDSFAEISQHV